MSAILPTPRTATQWAEQRPTMVAIALEGRWAVGDWLNAADRFGIEDERVLALNVDPRWEGTEAGAWMFVARRFPTPARRWPLPWRFYEAVALLDDPAAAALLDDATAEGWNLKTLRSAVTRTKAGR